MTPDTHSNKSTAQTVGALARALAGPKHRALAVLLDALAVPLADDVLAIDPRWRTNEEALGVLATDLPGVTAFVFTYAQPRDCYAVELDYPDTMAATAAGMVLSHEALGFDALLDVLRTHFDLPEHA